MSNTCFVFQPLFINASSPAGFIHSPFDPNKDTKLIIHGFIDTGFKPWVTEMSLALLELGDFNVIAVDWGGGSASLYSQAAANTRLVGLEIAHLIDKLVVSI